jgi:hypothetical protein
VVLEVDGVPVGPDKHSMLIWRAGEAVVVLEADGVPAGAPCSFGKWGCGVGGGWGSGGSR